MFTNPKVWVQGESGIRAESVNNSVPNNITAIRSLCSSHAAVSSTYPGSTLTFPTLYTTVGYTAWTAAYAEYTFPSTNDATLPSIWGVGPTVVGSRNQSGIVWIPMASLLAAKKSTESLFWNITIAAAPISSTFSGSISMPAWGRLAAITAKASYQYLGSNLDATSAAPIRTIDFLPQSSEAIASNRTATWSTGNVALNTQDMSSTAASIACFRVMFRVYPDTSLNFINTVGAQDFTLNVTVGIG